MSSALARASATAVIVLALVNSALSAKHIIKYYGSPGCGKPQLNAGEPVILSSSGGNRTFIVSLPSSYTNEQYDNELATPMIISYHGRGKTMYEQQTLSRFSDPSINSDMIAVYPQGIDNAWEGAPYAAEGVSDKSFTTDLLGYMRNNYCIDNRRIYASGKSNGGGFVDTLACSPDHGGDFAAFAMASAALYTDSTNTSSCTPASLSVPILEFHGTDDTTIPYAGGAGEDGADLPAISSWLATWALRNRCSNPPQAATSDQYDGKVHYTTYNCGGVANIVQGYKDDGQKHWWPSKLPNADNGGHVALIEGSAIMIDFFNTHSKP